MFFISLIRRFVLCLLRILTRCLYPRKDVNKNIYFLKFTKDFHDQITSVSRDLEKCQSQFLICSSEISGSCECFNPFLKRLNKNVRSKLRDGGADEHLTLDLSDI